MTVTNVSADLIFLTQVRVESGFRVGFHFFGASFVFSVNLYPVPLSSYACSSNNCGLDASAKIDQKAIRKPL